MRRFLLIAVGVCLCAAAGAQSPFVHGTGDPRLRTPETSCSARFYIDDSTGQMYLAGQGSPCVWTLPSQGIGIPGVASDGANGLTVAGAVAANASSVVSRVFDCAAYADISACITAANTYATNNPTTGGHSIDVFLHDQVYTVTGALPALNSGVNIRGVMPRQTNATGTPPDYNLSPNGGTVIQCSTPSFTLFSGGPLSGNTLENLEISNCGTAGVFGSQNVIGMSESVIRNVFVVGNPTCCSSNGFTIYNPQNVDTYNVHMLNVDSCWKWLSNNTVLWGPGNVNSYNNFCKSYAKSAANGNASVPLMTVGVSAGTDPLALMTFTGLTQLQSYGGDNTGTALSVVGSVVALRVDALDVEGALGAGVTSSSMVNSVINIASTNLPHTSAVLNLSGSAQLNTFYSGSPNTTVVNSDPSNMFYGLYYQVPASGVMSGAYRSYNNATVLTSLQADSVYITNPSAGLFFTPNLSATSSNNYGSAPQAFCGNYWNGSATTQDCFQLVQSFNTNSGVPTSASLQFIKPGLTGKLFIPLQTFFGTGNPTNFAADGSLSIGSAATLQLGSSFFVNSVELLENLFLPRQAGDQWEVQGRKSSGNGTTSAMRLTNANTLAATDTVLEVDNNGNSPTYFYGNGLLAATAFQSNGTKFTAAGCTSITSTSGGATAGKFTVGANSCTVVITMNGATGLTAPAGYSCRANDETTAAGNTGLYFSANSTTTATLTVPAGAVASDVIDFACIAF